MFIVKLNNFFMASIVHLMNFPPGTATFAASAVNPRAEEMLPLAAERIQSKSIDTLVFMFQLYLSGFGEG